MATDRPLVVLAGPIHPAGRANLETEARVVVCDDETEAGFLSVAAGASTSPPPRSSAWPSSTPRGATRSRWPSTR